MKPKPKQLKWLLVLGCRWAGKETEPLKLLKFIEITHKLEEIQILVAVIKQLCH